MRLGIIIPTYDSLDTLKILVKQIYKYTKGDFKVYIVEDGQNKKTIKWLWSEAKKHENLEVILHPVNRGVGPSWNSGLDKALDDYCTHFAILNDDIELCKDWWETCLKEFKDNVHMVCLDQPCPIPMTGWFFILDRHCIEEIGIFDEQFAPFTSEDADYWYRFQASGMKMVKVNLPVFHHGSHTINKIDRLKFKEIWNDNWNKLRRKYPHISMQDESK